MNNNEDILYKNIYGYSTLWIAAWRGSTKCVERLANEKPELVDMTEPTYNRTPLHIASYYGQFETVQYLVKQQNASLTSTNLLGLTSLLYACYGGANNVIKFLLRNKADLNALDTEGNNCLIRAAIGQFNERSHIQVLNYMFQLKPELLNKTNYY